VISPPSYLLKAGDNLQAYNHFIQLLSRNQWQLPKYMGVRAKRDTDHAVPASGKDWAELQPSHI
jgi:predicted oxidoreductase (fatty acid repression mutant protein)